MHGSSSVLVKMNEHSDKTCSSLGLELHVNGDNGTEQVASNRKSERTAVRNTKRKKENKKRNKITHKGSSSEENVDMKENVGVKHIDSTVNNDNRVGVEGVDRVGVESIDDCVGVEGVDRVGVESIDDCVGVEGVDDRAGEQSGVIRSVDCVEDGSSRSSGESLNVPSETVVPSPAGGSDACESALPLEAAVLETAEIDPEWVEEEERLLTQNRLEAERTRRQLEESSKQELKEERYGRLMKLLNHSQFYVNYLSKKLEEDRMKLQQEQEASGKSSSSTFRKGGKRSKKRALVDDGGGDKKRARTGDSGESSSQSSSQELEAEKISDPQHQKQLPQPRLLEGVTLRQYQMEGYNWLRVMYINGVNCILGDEMGLGKTLQAISVIAHLVEESVAGPFLVVAPLSTLPNWLSEFRRFCPSMPVLLYHGTDRRQLQTQIAEGQTVPGVAVPVRPVVLTTYEVAIRDVQLLSGHAWKYLIVDEGHRIKNHQCRLIRELRRYRVHNRLLLTGTPLQNDLSELWSLLNFLLPEIFDDLAVFESWFDVGTLGSADEDAKLVEQERESHVISTLHRILSPFLLRRIKTDVDLQIPPKREVLVYCPMVESQARMYAAVVDRTIEQLLKRTGQQEGEKQDAGETEVARDENGRPVRSSRNQSDFRFLFSSSDSMDKWMSGVEQLSSGRSPAASSSQKSSLRHIHLPLQSNLMVMRHVVNHPFLIEHPIDPDTKQLQLCQDVGERSGKLKVLDAMLQRLLANNHKVLVFSQFTRMLAILADFLTVRGIDFVQLDGSYSIGDRQEAIDRFNTDDKLRVFLISTRAGGLGINLCAADTIVIYDSDWNPQRDLQAQDRAHRIGQTRPVMVYRLVTAGTVDERIVQRASSKRKLERMVMHGDQFKSAVAGHLQPSGRQLEPEQLLQLLKDTHNQRVIRAQSAALSEQELAQLMDRSELYKVWDKHGTETATPSSVDA